ncbi:MAG: ribbon-helix-helix protein, CopG family [Mycobacteriales bacterium]
MSVRLADDAYAALHARAEQEHRSVSDLAREAIELYIAG